MKSIRWSGAVAGIVIVTAGLASFMAMALPLENDPGGVGTERTRYIYNEGVRQVGVSLSNKTRETYLVQAWVRGIDPKTGEVKNEEGPFFLKQPLVKALPDGRYGYQVIQTRPVMVNDRESLYLLSFKLIPSEEKGGEASYNRANVVLTYNVKLFYRPTALKNGKVVEAAKSMTFSRQDNEVQINNPTPYWITFYSLNIGGMALPEVTLRQMVPPFSMATYALPAAINASTLKWQIIDENGDITKEVTSPL
ncbi:Chaperone protein fimC precursor [Serratia quinivorans]|jgi:fimbrial chaperone protein|uniref:fimbrial biogenesis chaperone n=1 Tax=Serratia quinivorans TaxID=137545 RepID=UPI00217C2880|nr:molecular chaperone [Serratia quinivorans]CAI1016709.1 Chaperone protein fimC precursor [Serratia quinivorans]CAI1057750.1 Chaperone protein fimC precursor [Serratia quinivorans]CAI1240183.1 Chaperone protein fimC precursor [Serratia quinivorans]CAI2023940.1 Chaperone protein fimC precursor [Serratia quinivorans]CAI2160502.1 Chaperone protein fimC precursor [Serratia quinivorans]